MAYGTNKFGKKPLTPNMKHVQTNGWKENYTKKLNQAEDM